MTLTLVLLVLSLKTCTLDGIGYIDTLAVHENATVAGTLNVTGVITAPAGVVANHHR